MKKQKKMQKIVASCSVLLILAGQSVPVYATITEAAGEAVLSDNPVEETEAAPVTEAVPEVAEAAPEAPVTTPESTPTPAPTPTDPTPTEPPVVAVDRKNLDALIQEAEGLAAQTATYTTDYCNRLWETAARGKAVGADQGAVDALITELTALIGEKELTSNQVPKPIVVDKAALQGAITQAQGLKAAAYTAASFKAVKTALAEAQSVLGQEAATQGTVDAATSKLQAAIKALKQVAAKPTPTPTPTPAPNKEQNDTPKQSDNKQPVDSSKVQGPEVDASINENLLSDSLTESDLNGYELPLLQSFKDKRQAAVVAEALKNLSKEYEADAYGPDKFDNLNFVRYVYNTVFGADLGTSYEALTQTGEHRELKDAQAGDLLFWQQEDKPAKTGIYLGAGKYILADDENLEELKKQAEEEAQLKKQEAEAKGEEYKEEEIKIPGVRIFTLEGYSEEEDGTVTIDDEAAKAALQDEKDDQASPLLENYTRENPDYAVGMNQDYTLSSAGQELVDKYAASIDFRANQSTEGFIETIGETARELGLKYDVYASVMIAQAIIESGSGGSGLSRAPYYNLFGIKGSFQGNSVTMATMEDNGSGSLYGIDAAFRSYGSYENSLLDYVQLIRGGISGNDGFYSGAWRSNAKNYLQATEYLKGRYATDTTYNNKLNSIIAAYNLTQYDEPKEPTAASGETSVIMQSRSEIPEYYRQKMVFPDYNGVNYNTSGSYPVGQCTWYVYNRVRQLGGSVDNFMGNGGEWGSRGSRLGYYTTATPKVGYAVSFHPGVAGSDPRYGHVAFVEAVGPDGILVSEGNVVGGTTISYRVIPNSIARSSQVTYVAPK